MARQERMAQGQPCPRGCGYKVHPTHPAISDIDGKQICVDCRIGEVFSKHRRS